MSAEVFPSSHSKIDVVVVVVVVVVVLVVVVVVVVVEVVIAVVVVVVTVVVEVVAVVLVAVFPDDNFFISISERQTKYGKYLIFTFNVNSSIPFICC